MRRYQWWIMGLCFAVTTFDGFDTQAIAFTGPAIAGDFAVDAGGLAPIITAGVAGMAAGAMLFGPIGDRYGRRLAVILATFLFGAFALATAFATSATQLVIFRFLTGIGMGGATPNVLALVAEYVPSRVRAMMMMLAALGLPVGAIIGGQLAGTLIPEHGWQAVFIVGGVAPLLMLPLLWRWFPESPYFLADRGQDDAVCRLLARVDASRAPPPGSSFVLPEKPSRVGVAALLTRELRRSTLAIWATYFFNWIAWYALVLWLPTAFTSAGLPIERAPQVTIVLNGAALVLLLPVAWYLPRLPVRAMIVTLLAGGVLTALAMAAIVDNWPVMFGLVALSGLVIGGPQLALNYLAAQIYPTTARATGVGWAIGAGRIGTIAGGAIGGPLLVVGGAEGFFAALAIPLAVAALAALLVRPAAKAPG